MVMRKYQDIEKERRGRGDKRAGRKERGEGGRVGGGREGEREKEICAFCTLKAAILIYMEEYIVHTA